MIDELGARAVAVVGHSLGGDAFVDAAGRTRDRVAGIVWIDTFPSIGNEPHRRPQGRLGPFILVAILLILVL